MLAVAGTTAAVNGAAPTVLSPAVAAFPMSQMNGQAQDIYAANGLAAHYPGQRHVIAVCDVCTCL